VDGQVALVTGASRGIGRVMAARLAAEGAQVALLARSRAGLEETARLVAAAGARAWIAAVDVTDPRAVADAVGGALRDLGHFDLLVNNAGVTAKLAPVAEADPDEWWSTVDINLRGTFLVLRAVLPSMLGRRSGRVVNVVSNAGVHRWPWMSAYSVSKAAVIKLTENVAAEVRNEGVVAFAFHPGLVNAGLTDAVWTEFRADAPPGSREAKIRSWFAGKVAAGETVSAEAVADFVVTLASGRYDALSGRYVTIDDDLDALLARIEEVRRDDLLTLRLRA